MIGTMATIALPEKRVDGKRCSHRPRRASFFGHRIEVQVHAFRGRLYVRICGQVYIELADIERWPTP